MSLAAAVACAALLSASCSSGASAPDANARDVDPAAAPAAGEDVDTPGGSPTEPLRSDAPWPPVASGRFVDVTESLGAALLHISPLGEKEDGMRMMGGAAAGDFDADGFTDLFVVGGGLVPDALWMNNGDGTFADRAAEAGVDRVHLGSGASVADYDGDGDLDIYVTAHGDVEDRRAGMNLLYRNRGDATFEEVARAAGVAFTSPEIADGFGAAFGDVDLDGDLDLFVTGWRKQSLGNRLFENNGDGTFTDVTDAAGIVDDGIRGFAPCIVDMDGDRYPELLLVADFSTSRYFVNQADGTFVEQGQRAGALKEQLGMGTAVGDVDNDGRLDWYTTAVRDDDSVGRGSGNKLYLNRGPHQYEEVAELVGVDDGGWGWGAAMVDLDHDGRLDIVETNGWPLPSYESENSKVFLQRPDGTFAESADLVGLDHHVHGLSVVTLDLENDGDQDLVFTSANDRVMTFRNDLPEASAGWFRVFLDTSGSPGLAPNGFGARVRVRTGDAWQLRNIDGCANYLSTNEPSAHFGLAGASAVDEVLVEWPDGTTTRLEGLEPNQTVVIRPE